MNEDTGHVEVCYCSTHSHPIRLAHIRIHNQTRMNIAAKLQQGVGMERILDDIRDSVTNTIRRKYLIRRQDLYNIKAQYNIDGIMRHSWLLATDCIQQSTPICLLRHFIES